MDVGRNDASKRMTASPVRQFAPSRVERELLAQVFDLMFGERTELTRSSFASNDVADVEPGSDCSASLQPSVARRQVA
jgi:hypothetical protein